MPTFEEQRTLSDNRKLIRKVQSAIGVIAPKSVELPASLYDGGSLIDLKTAGFLPIGIVTKDGYNFGREVETEEVDGLGYASPVREDTVKVPREITFTPLESGRRHMLEMKYGTTLADTKQDSVTGEVVFDEPDLPIGEEYRLLVLASDGPTANNWILGKGYGAVKLTGGGDETWGGEDPVASELTFKVFVDDEIGSPVRHYMGGTGALKAQDVLDFDLSE